MRLKAWAPARLRKQPETFCCTLIIRRSRSARLLSKSTRRSSEARREPLSGVCASDRANCGQGFVCICPGSWRSSGPWSRLIALMQQAEELRFPVRHFHRMQPVPSLGACLLGRLPHIQKQTLELLCPDDSLFFCQEHQLTEKDRKSTRLNSSHPSISYAVFCLKK